MAYLAVPNDLQMVERRATVSRGRTRFAGARRLRAMDLAQATKAQE